MKLISDFFNNIDPATLSLQSEDFNPVVPGVH